MPPTPNATTLGSGLWVVSGGHWGLGCGCGYFVKAERPKTFLAVGGFDALVGNGFPLLGNGIAGRRKDPLTYPLYAFSLDRHTSTL